jgi:hypothetical protein
MCSPDIASAVVATQRWFKKFMPGFAVPSPNRTIAVRSRMECGQVFLSYKTCSFFSLSLPASNSSLGSDAASLKICSIAFGQTALVPSNGSDTYSGNVKLVIRTIW